MVKGCPLRGYSKKFKKSQFWLIVDQLYLAITQLFYQKILPEVANKGLAILLLGLRLSYCIQHFCKPISILKAPSLSLSVHPSHFLGANNSALGGHRALPKVANERYCNSFYFLSFYLCTWARMHSTRVQKVYTKTQLRVVTERSQRWQMKGIAIMFWFLGSFEVSTQAGTRAGTRLSGFLKGQ